jgi:long-subunit fatty acid transport protein
MVQMSFAQPESNFNLYGNGARAAGMGYAFTGLADDATAISWNPAGLTQLMSMEASVVGRFGFGSWDIEFPGLDVQPDVETGSNFNLNFASFVMPFKVSDFNVVGGIAYRRVYDSNFNLTVKYEGETAFETEITGGVSAIAPSVGFQLNEMLSLGATLNFLMGSTESDYGEGENNTEDYSGTAIELGALIKPTPQLSFGVNVKLPFTVEMEGSGETEGFEYDYDDELHFPMFFDLGAAFRATENLTLAADYRIHPVDKIEDEDDDPIFDEDLDVTGNSLHIGLEYLMQAGESVMPLRLGFYTYPSSYFESSLDGGDPEQVIGNGFSAGIGLIMGNLIFDAAFEYIPLSYTEVFFDGLDYYDMDWTQKDFRITLGAVLHLGQK